MDFFWEWGYPCGLGVLLGVGSAFLSFMLRRRKYDAMVVRHKMEEEKVKGGDWEEYIALVRKNRAIQDSYLDAWWKLF